VPARKRRARRSRRRPKRGWQAGAVAAALGLAVVAALLLQRWSAPRTPSHSSTARKLELPPTRPSRAKPEAQYGAGEIAAEYGVLLARTGGDEIWVKRAAQPAREGHDLAERGEVLALPAAFAAVRSRLQQRATRDGFELEARAGDGRRNGDGRDIELDLSKEGATICAWRLREVPRLYRAAIVIDDLGQEIETAREVLGIPYPLTFSVLPDLPESRQTAAAANEAGREVMLHLPMEPLAKMNPGPGAIRVGMSAREVDAQVENDLASVPYVAGVNNHMGSRATSDGALMADVMKELAAHHLYFIDSRTAGSSVALEAARRAGIPAFYRSVFLDDTESVAYTLGQLERLRGLVMKQGVALAIGHPHPTTLAALQQYLPQFERGDIEVVPASQLVRLAEVAHLLPPRSSATENGN
jgi:uncharacterized protein